MSRQKLWRWVKRLAKISLTRGEAFGPVVSMTVWVNFGSNFLVETMMAVLFRNKYVGVYGKVLMKGRWKGDGRRTVGAAGVGRGNK